MIEIGPGQSLAALVRQHMDDTADDQSARAYVSMRRSGENVDDAAILLSALGHRWLAGQAVDWSALHTGESVRSHRNEGRDRDVVTFDITLGDDHGRVVCLERDGAAPRRVASFKRSALTV
jgi:acyl transferase domain-containing protein